MINYPKHSPFPIVKKVKYESLDVIKNKNNT